MTQSAAGKPLFLSASRIDTFKTCSTLYWAKYGARLPERGNDGSNRGSLCHEVLELLVKPRHKRIYTAAIMAGKCSGVPSLWRVIQRKAKVWRVSDPANLQLIDGFIMVALVTGFFGPKGSVVHAEKEFSLQVNEDGKRYNVRGVIDKIFECLEGKVLYTEATDYKGSRQKFSADKLDHNTQSYIYQLALRRMFPKAILRRFHFLFLKFPKAPVQEQPVFSDDQLSGFEYQLTAWQSAMEGFTDKNAADNLAVHDDERKWLCGKEGLKKDGTTAFICSARLPLDYWVLLDENGEWVASAFKEDELTPKEGQVVVPRHWSGCSAFFNPKTGLRRNTA
jgi:PD-(D/E)XK nuclease superfamily protein